MLILYTFIYQNFRLLKKRKFYYTKQNNKKGVQAAHNGKKFVVFNSLMTYNI